MFSQLCETFGKCQVQSDNWSLWPEPMPMVIKYNISVKLPGNFNITLELFLLKLQLKMYVNKKVKLTALKYLVTDNLKYLRQNKVKSSL